MFWNKKILLLLTASVLVIVFVLHNFMLSLTKDLREAPTQVSYHSPPSVRIEPGSGVEVASYIIFHDNETPKNYYAKNGLTGEIEFSGTDASKVIQSAIDALTGTYTINTPLKIPVYPTYAPLIQGEGTKKTILKLGDGVNDDVITTADPTTLVYWLQIYDLTIDGYGINLSPNNLNFVE
jgi:hypothetical protein